jgi:dihydrodipicolinate synthase/N-acetylneuraminate lyase
MFTDFNPELKKKVMQALVEGRSERGLLINRVMLAEMRARKHGQIPQKIEYATGQ